MIQSIETKFQQKTSEEKSVCALCEEFIGFKEVSEGNLSFCCHGCRAVYQILACQNQLDNKKNHPLIKQAVQYGVISNPLLINRIRLQEETKAQILQKATFSITGMWCPFCAEFIHLVLGQQKGVRRCHVDYITDLSSIEYNPMETSLEQIKEWIQGLGYGAEDIKDRAEAPISFWLILRFAVAAFCALNVMMFSYPLYATYFDLDLEEIQPILAWIALFITLPVMIFSGFPIYKRCLAQFQQGRLALESFVGVGTLSAFILSLWEMGKGTHLVYFDTITVVITFLLLGKMIESQAKFSTKSALLRLHQAIPRKGRKKCDEASFKFVPVKEIQIGDEILAYTGERIVLDGEIIEGEASCDESLLTGEAQPIFKSRGDLVFSGTILQSGVLHFRVTAQEKESTLHRILNLIQNEIGHKSIYVQSVDKIVKWMMPLILVVAFATFLLGFSPGISLDEATRRALAVVLIACPCAIGIAAPLVESRLLHRFAEKGALVRNRSLFTLLPKATHFVFDKTGTITEGRFQVLSGLDNLGLEEKRILKSLTSFSIHPIALAIHKALDTTTLELDSFQEIPGRGIEGKLNGKTYYLGSHHYVTDKGLRTLSPDQEISTVYFFTSEQMMSVITLGDKVQPDALDVMQKLKPLKRILLSGDHTKVVESLAHELAFDAWKAEASPLDKQLYIAKLKEEGAVVAMIGDGINDAPALAKADVAISVVSATDLSIQVSDLILTSDKLSTLNELCQLAKKGYILMRQNLFWAFFYNLIGIALAVTGVLTPVFASFAMIMSSLFVLFNAKRV